MPEEKFNKEKLKILVVDDTEDILNMIVDALKEQDFHVIPAHNASEAFEHLNKGALDIVLSDIEMPHLDGIWLLEQAKSINPSLLFFLMSGRSLEFQDVALEKGADGVFPKPFDIENFIRSLKKI